jgi:rubrerythrin
MGITFSTTEVLEMAEKMERDGASFYRKAAERFQNAYVQKLFTELVEWENKHEELFAGMRERLRRADEQAGDLGSDDDLVVYSQAMKGLDVFGAKTDPARQLTGTEGIKDVLKKAIVKEKDSIVFYSALKAFVPSQAGRETIDDIIKEETHHIRILNQSLQALM